jgi:hypothetical protein
MSNSRINNKISIISINRTTSILRNSKIIGVNTTLNIKINTTIYKTRLEPTSQSIKCLYPSKWALILSRTLSSSTQRHFVILTIKTPKIKRPSQASISIIGGMSNKETGIIIKITNQSMRILISTLKTLIICTENQKMAWYPSRKTLRSREKTLKIRTLVVPKSNQYQASS